MAAWDIIEKNLIREILRQYKCTPILENMSDDDKLKRIKDSDVYLINKQIVNSMPNLFKEEFCMNDRLVDLCYRIVKLTDYKNEISAKQRAFNFSYSTKEFYDFYFNDKNHIDIIVDSLKKEMQHEKDRTDILSCETWTYCGYIPALITKTSLDGSPRIGFITWYGYLKNEQ